MITIEQCEKIIRNNGNQRFNKDEIRAIRSFLYQLAQLECETKF